MAKSSQTGVHGKKKSGTKPVLVVIFVVLLLLIILFVAASAIMHHYLNKINKTNNDEIEVVAPTDADDEADETVDTDLFPEVDESDVTWADAEELQDDERINILLVGQDSRTGARERSDSMILVSINPDTGEASMISFMRDLYVQMPEGYQDNRMNAAYAFGGFPYLYEVLEKNFGITCDGGFEVNFDGFTSVVDTLGGVDIELTAAEAEYIGGGLTAGVNHLNGTQALTYSRIRYIDSDFYRTGRQRTVLTALFNKVKGSDLNTLLDLANTLLPMMTTDMSNTEIISLVMKLAPLMSGMEVGSYRIPADDTYTNATIRGMMVLVPDLAKNQLYLQETCLPYSD